MVTPFPAEAAGLFARAEALFRDGSAVQAELLFRRVLDIAPHHVPTRRWLADLIKQRGDRAAAASMLSKLADEHPADAEIVLHAASALWQEQLDERAALLARRYIDSGGHDERVWLLLAEILEAQGDGLGALAARQGAFSRAHKAGRWLNDQTTEPSLRAMVSGAAKKYELRRREHLYSVFEGVRQEVGSSALQRVDRALAGYLGDITLVPPDPRQRPKFLYVPDLPPGPYHDPHLHPWAAKLQAQWADIRDEALAVIESDTNVRSFLDFKPGDPVQQYVAGSGYGGRPPSWDAFFFYRRGHRFDANHALCPVTSEVLESLDLCRIDHQTPEVCFSLLPAGSHIVAHHGTTNSRLVVHLGLIVPPNCALHVIGAQERHCGEGELLAFDDTFEHEAWNRSDRLRVIVLMDSWNPHLTPPEREALRQLVQAIDALENPK